MNFFKKLKFHTKDYTFSKFYILDVPIFEYIKINGKKHYRLSTSKLIKKAPVFYLKFNSSSFMYSMPCLSRWIEIAKFMNADFYIICDKDELIKKIADSCIFYNTNVKFLKSDRYISKKILKIVSTKSWEKAARAHLTTFYHSKKNNIKNFWNIDADDTMFMLSNKKIANCLTKIATYADKQNYNLFSLDMHHTRYYGKHWTFGITYTRNIVDYLQILKNEKSIEWRKDFDKIRAHGQFNVDSYFAYLKNHNKLSIGTFNIDNVYFIHWGTVGLPNMYRFIQIEKNNILHFPVGEKLFNENEYSKLKTVEGVINFDLGVEEQESYKNFYNTTFKFIKAKYKACLEQ